MIARLLERLGIAPRPFGVLLRVGLILDFRGALRSAGGVQRESTISPLMILLVLYVLMSLLLGLFTFRSMDPYSFALFQMSYGALMMGMLTIGEFGLSFFDDRDRDILGHAPMSSRTYYAVKFCNVLFFAGAFGLGLCLVPAVLGCWTRGGTALFLPIFLSLSLLNLLFVVSLALLLYSLLMRLFPMEKVKSAIFYVQILFQLVLIIGYQFITQFAGQLGALRLTGREAWLYAFPPAWFAGPISLLHHGYRPASILQFGIGLGAVVVTLYLCLVRLSGRYLERLHGAEERKLEPASKRPGRALGGAIRWLLRIRAPEERVGLDFVSAMLRHDRTAKMTLFSGVAVVVAFALFYLLKGDCRNPYEGSFSMGPWTIFGMVLLMIPMTLLSLCYSPSAEAAWFLFANPIRRYGLFYRGAKKALTLVLILPIFLLLFAAFAVSWGPAPAALFVGSGFLQTLAVFHGLSLWFYSVPYSIQPKKGQQSAMVAAMLLLMPVVGVLCVVQALVSRYLRPGVFVMGGLALAACFVLSATATRRATARPPRWEESS